MATEKEKQAVDNALNTAGWPVVLEILSEYAEEMVEWTKNRRRAGDEGILAKDWRGWHSASTKLEDLAIKIRDLPGW